MVIASIDMKDGHVVQLKNGKDLVLQRDDADSLISEFNKYGEVAIIDLDQALRNTDEKGNTKNTELLKHLLRRGNVRVGGGIRDVKKARELSRTFLRCWQDGHRTRPASGAGNR